jgi:hypothetical protein
MSVEQLEEQIRQLPPADLARLAGWLDEFLGRSMPGDASDDDLTEEEKAELLRRRDEVRGNAALAQPMNDAYFDGLKRDLADARTRKASGS